MCDARACDACGCDARACDAPECIVGVCDARFFVCLEVRALSRWFSFAPLIFFSFLFFFIFSFILFWHIASFGVKRGGDVSDTAGRGGGGERDETSGYVFSVFQFFFFVL